MEKKVTKKENFVAIREILENAGRDDLVAVVDHELELMAKKTNNKKKEENQKANSVLDERILALLKVTDGLTATEITKAVDTTGIEKLDGEQPSLPKVTNRLTAMVKAEVIRREQDKKIIRFYINE